MAPPNTPNESDALNTVLAALYCGPLEDFIRSRDALAKELRSAGNRDAAAAAKAARKPSRPAWALNAGVHADGAALAGLEDAVALTLQAQAEGGDVRAAMGVLRAAVRDLARAGEEAASRAGQSIDAAALASAILAVLGRPDSFDRLRHGLLTDIPEAGGLDFLANLPAPARTAPAPVRVQAPAPPGPDPDAEARARAARTAEALAVAEAAAAAATGRQQEAEADLAQAQERARRAQADLEAAEQRLAHARSDAEAAAAALRQAEADNEEAQRLTGR